MSAMLGCQESVCRFAKQFSKRIARLTLCSHVARVSIMQREPSSSSAEVPSLRVGSGPVSV